MNPRLSPGVVWLFAAVLAGGCSSPQMNRIDRHRDVYEKWPLEIRQAVLDGKVEAGMDYDMVKVAWGEPTEITNSPAGDEIWVYAKGGNPGSVYYPSGGPNYPSGGYPSGTYPGGVVGGPSIGISTGRGGTAIGGSGGIGVGGSMGGVGVGGTGMGGMGGPIVTPPTPPEFREVTFRNGVVVKADKP